MIIKLKELSKALSELSELTSGDKNVYGVMFDISEDSINICYTDANSKVFKEKIDVVTSENDIKEKIIFNYTAFNRIIEACKPTGKIITDTVDFEFCENQVIKVKAEKKIPINDSEETKTVSVIEQSIGWVATDSSPRIAALTRGNYELLHHYDDSIVQENYPDDPNKANQIRPLTTGEWEKCADEWEASELKDILAKLSIENGKLVYIAPNARTAFVNNTSCVICIPIRKTIRNRVILSASVAKSLSNVIAKLNTTDNKVYTHMLDNDTVVYSTGDNVSALSIKNARQDNNNIIQMGTAVAKDYGQYMLNFNREVLESCLLGAKTAGASDKATLAFEVETNNLGKKSAKLIMSAKNTNSSTDNTYDVTADYVVDIDDGLAGLQLNVTLDIIHQAVSRASSEYIAFDIHLEEDGKKYLRVGEIDLEQRAQISTDKNVSGPWSIQFTQENRHNMLGYTTYFAVGAE